MQARSGSSPTTISQPHVLIVGWFDKFEFVMNDVFFVDKNSNASPSNNRWVVSHNCEKLENISGQLERHVGRKVYELLDGFACSSFCDIRRL